MPAAARIVRSSTLRASRSPAAELTGAALRALDASGSARLEDLDRDLVVIAVDAGRLSREDVDQVARDLERRLR